MHASSHVSVKTTQSTSKNKIDVSSLPPEVLELLTSEKETKNYKGIGLAVLVIAIILILIIISIIIIAPDAVKVNVGKTLSLDDFIKIKSIMRKCEFNWIGDNFIYKNDRNDIVSISTTAGVDPQSTRILLLRETQSTYNIEQSAISPSQDMSLFLIRSPKKMQSTSQPSYKILHFENRWKSLNIDPDGHDQAPSLHSANWGPQKGYLSVVYRNNVYYSLNPRQQDSFRCITCSQSQQFAYGVSEAAIYDESYEGERISHWWNSNGQFIAIMGVEKDLSLQYSYPVYGRHRNLYEKSATQFYVKAGAKKSRNQTVLVANLLGNSIFDLTNSLKQKTREHYLAFIRWMDTSRILIGSCDKSQSQGWINMCDVIKETCDLIWQSSMTYGWIDMFKQGRFEPILDPEQNRFFIIMPQKIEDDFHNHIQQVSIISGRMNQITWITSGPFSVLDIHRYSQTENSLYFSSAQPTFRMRNLYRVKIGKLQLECISCGHPNCTFNDFRFSEGSDYFLQLCLGPMAPTYTLKSIKSQNAQWNFTVENNTLFKKEIALYNLPKVEDEYLKSVNKDFQGEISIRMIYPYQLNKDHITKYPLLLILSEFPWRQSVTDEFTFDWTTHLSATIGFICLKIDWLGTPNQGRKFQMALRENPDLLMELLDLKSILADFKSKPYIPEDRIGVMGQFFGGYNAIRVLSHPSIMEFARCGVAIAPVTDVHYYDKVTVTKYFGANNKNFYSYSTTNLSAYSKNLKDKGLLLVHGMSNEKFHFQNTALFIQSLVNEDIDFNTMVYPDISDVMDNPISQKHVHRHILNFLVGCFNRTSVRWPPAPVKPLPDC